MKVKALMELLSSFDGEKEVSIFWDGVARGDVDDVINSQNEVAIVGTGAFTGMNLQTLSRA